MLTQGKDRFFMGLGSSESGLAPLYGRSQNDKNDVDYGLSRSM